MPYCAVKWCGKCSKTSNLQKDNITFHRFPKCPNLKSRWIDATKQGDNWFPSKSSVICSRHFATDCFQLMKKRRLLFDNAEPTLMLPSLGPSQSESTSNENIIIVVPSNSLVLTTALPVTTLPETTSISSNTDCTENDLNIPMTLDMHDSDTQNHNSIVLQQKDVDSQQITSTDILKATSSFTSPKKRRLRRSIIDLSLKLKSKNLIIKRLRDSNRLLKKKVNSLKQHLEELKKNAQ